MKCPGTVSFFIENMLHTNGTIIHTIEKAIYGVLGHYQMALFSFCIGG